MVGLVVRFFTMTPIDDAGKTVVNLATWTTNAGKIVFVTPEGIIHEDSAVLFDHPRTVCEVLDMMGRLSLYERTALGRMIGNSTLMLVKNTLRESAYVLVPASRVENTLGVSPSSTASPSVPGFQPGMNSSRLMGDRQIRTASAYRWVRS